MNQLFTTFLFSSHLTQLFFIFILNNDKVTVLMKGVMIIMNIKSTWNYNKQST